MNDTYLGEVQAKRIAQNVMNLPTLPTVVAKMMQVMDDPRTTVSELSRLISSDQVLSAKLLKLANSAYFGLPRKVKTLDFAIILLGFDNLKTLSLGLSVIDRFSDNWDGAFDYTEFWEHAFGCAVASSMVARDICRDKKSEAFIAGLLHDIGKLILSQYAKRYFSVVIKNVTEYNSDFYSAEKALLGVTHADIAAWFADKWNFPVQLIKAILYHHSPAALLDENELASCVHLGDYLVRRCGVGFTAGRNLPEFDSFVFKDKNVLRDENGEIALLLYEEQLQLELEQADTFLNIIARGVEHAVD
ncbi:MAG: HDOD domain-containing protein [Deferribacteres bacterium]|nr:HDOD domain-containing protein [candidate division KSB1 bacterium]MCB9501948.1 HDOD domain-containing protein [Deferribacteres bacterium]